MLRVRARQVGIFAVSLLFGLLLASTVTATALQWWSEKPATLESIAVQGTSRLSGEDVARATGLARGSGLEGLSETELESTLEAHPWIREARVVLLPTGTLIIDVREREARAVLQDDSGAHFVDDAGIAFARVLPEDEEDAAELPLLVGSEFDAASLQRGLAIAELLDAVALPGLVRDGAPHRGLSLWVPRADDAPTGWVLRGGRGPEVILGSGDVATVGDRIDRLERLLTAAPVELAETTSIDLRFAGQAVLRQTSTSG